MEKRLILAIALSILIITSFQYFFGKKESGLPPAPVPEKISPAVPAGKTAPGEPLTAAPILDEKDVEVETDKQIVTFSNIGGAIKRIRSKDHKDHSSGEGVDIVGIKDPRKYIFS